MQIMRLPPGNVNKIIQIIQIIQIRGISALKDLDLEVGIDDLPELWNVLCFYPLTNPTAGV